MTRLRKSCLRLRPRSFTRFALMLLAPLAAASAGCGQTEKDAGKAADTTTTVTSALSTFGARVLGFETPLADWTATSGTRTQSSTRSEGSFSLGLSGTGSTTITSVPIDSLITVGDAFTVDVTLPTQQAGATFGTIQLFIDLPSRGINMAFVGQRDLVGLPTARFNRLAYMLPANIRTQLQQTYSDLRVRLVLNAPNNGGTWLFDRASFDVQPPGSPQPSIESRLVALEGAVTTLQSQVTTLQGQVSTLQTANTALTGRVGTLESGLAESNGRIATLESQNTTLTANVASLTARTTAAEAKNSLQDAAIESLNAGLASALARITALEGASLPPALVSQLQAIADHLTVTTVEGLASMVFTGVNVHVRDGSGSTPCSGAGCNGLGNLIIGYDAQRTSSTALRTGSHNVILGNGHEWTAYGGFVGGFENRINDQSAVVLSGRANTASGALAVVVGGNSNVASGDFSFIGGGLTNTASGTRAVVLSGEDNVASAETSTVVSGWQNTASGRAGSVSGGFGNFATAVTSSVAGGLQNTADAKGAAVLGGESNHATGENSTVSGGSGNTASGETSSVSGGRLNQATAGSSAVAGGQSCTADGINAVIGGGLNRNNGGILHSFRAGELFESQ